MKNVLNVSSLTSTCWSNKEWSDLIHDEELKHVTVSDGINGSNNDITCNGILWELINLILVREFHPIFPFICIWDIAVVINCSSVELTWKNLVLQFSYTFERSITDLFEMKIKWFSEFGVNANAERPDGSKEEARTNLLSKLLFVKIGEMVLIIKNFEKSSPNSKHTNNKALLFNWSRHFGIIKDIVKSWLNNNINKLIKNFKLVFSKLGWKLVLP